MGNQMPKGQPKKQNNQQPKRKAPPPVRVGRKKRGKGAQAATKLPTITPITKCRLRQLKL